MILRELVIINSVLTSSIGQLILSSRKFSLALEFYIFMKMRRLVVTLLIVLVVHQQDGEYLLLLTLLCDAIFMK